MSPSLSFFSLAWRNLKQSGLFSGLSLLSVSLGVTTTSATDIISTAIFNAFSQSGDALTFVIGILDQLKRSLVVISVVIAGAIGFVIFNTFLMVITQRRKQIATMRMIGATRRQIMMLVLMESLIIGSLGTSLGLVIGPLLGKVIIAFMKVYFEGIFVFSDPQTSPAGVFFAVALGLSATIISSIFPAWDTVHISPLSALRSEDTTKQTNTWIKRSYLGITSISILSLWLSISPPGEWLPSPWQLILTLIVGSLWLISLALCSPPIIYGIGKGVSKLFPWKAPIRIAADNFQRIQSRVVRTTITLALAFALIVSMTGFMTFITQELMYPKMTAMANADTWMITPFDISQGMSAYNTMESITLPENVITGLRSEFSDRVFFLETTFAIIPELSFFGSSYFTMVFSPDDFNNLEKFNEAMFSFTEGDWEIAQEIVETGCGVLTTPIIADQIDAQVSDSIILTSPDGPVRCTLAGVGSTFVSASIISGLRENEFGDLEPITVTTTAVHGENIKELKTDLDAFINHFEGVYISPISEMEETQIEMLDKMPLLFNGLLFLAIIAAAFGIINTTMITIVERRNELGLLRAVGGTRRQVALTVIIEAGFMGIVGGFLGLLAGAGMTIILATVYGGSAWGYPDLNLWAAAWRSLQPALTSGSIGLFLSPLICALSAWLPLRTFLYKSTSELVIE
jgi:putative ABC transport system permease protein